MLRIVLITIPLLPRRPPFADVVLGLCGLCAIVLWLSRRQFQQEAKMHVPDETEIEVLAHVER